jgi:hypothetical protein
MPAGFGFVAAVSNEMWYAAPGHFGVAGALEPFSCWLPHPANKTSTPIPDMIAFFTSSSSFSSGDSQEYHSRFHSNSHRSGSPRLRSESAIFPAPGCADFPVGLP